MSIFPDVVTVSGVSKQFSLKQDKSLKERFLNHDSNREESFWALRDIDFEIPMNCSVGLMGHNGSGKSTLLKIIGSIIQPTTGTVRHRGRIAALLELGAGFHQDLTGRENVFLNASILGMTRAETEAAFDDIVDFSGIAPFIDTQVKFYSSGMYVRLAFAVAVHSDPDILLVDEVLAVGDEPFQRKCMDKIREFQAEGRTIILVSHSAEQVGSVCDRAMVLDGGAMVYDGDTQDAIHVLRDSFQRREDSGTTTASHSKGLVEIDSVELLNARHERTAEISTGDAAVLAVEFTAHSRLHNWMAAMSVESSLGQLLFRFDTLAAHQELPEVEGSARVEFTIPEIVLGDGSFPINVGIGDQSGTTLARQSGATVLNVRGPYVGTGPVGMRPTVAVVPGFRI